MKILENITTGYKRIATGIAIVLFLTVMYMALIPGGSVAASGVYGALSGTPIAGALVKIVEWPQYNATTDSNGNYTMPDVPEGTYLISASAPGYTTNVSSVTVMGGTTVYKNFTLTSGYNWYFAEGSITDSTDAYVQLSNPGATPVNVDVKFMLTDGTVVTNTSVIPENTTRIVDAKQVLPTPSYFSIQVLSDKKIAAERTMVFSEMNWGGKIIDDVHETIGTTELNTTWYFAEGSITADTFAYVQILNPNAVNANVTVEYMKTDGTVITTSKNLRATSRDYFDPRDVLPLPSYFSVRVTSDIPIMSERTMVFANISWGGKIINGFHDTIGSTKLSNTWSIGGGYIAEGVESYIQILNPNNQNASLSVKFMRTDGIVVMYSKEVLKNSRDYIYAGDHVSGWYSAQITSDQPIMIEKTEVFAGVTWHGRYIDGFGDTVEAIV